MSTIDITLTPSRVNVSLTGNTGVFENPLTSAAQTIDRGGLRWHFVYEFANLYGANRATLMSIIAQLRGQANRLRVPVHDNPARGAYGGSPLVDGANQTGNSLAVKGCSNTITNWIRAGDYFSVVVNGEHELKICTADASSDGSGDIAALTFQPRLRAAPADGAVIRVEDGVLAKPTGIFIPASSELGWNSDPHVGGQLSGFSLDLIEDIFATQA